jgi:superfamily II DNA helicase RecQ
MEFLWVAQPSGAPAAQGTSTAATTARRPHNPPTSLNAIKDTICYLHEYRTLVCKQHATALQNLDAHLRQHHSIRSQARKQIVESYCDYNWIRDPHEVTLPAPLGPPIAELGAPLDGFQCVEDDCGFLTINVDELRKHQKRAHNVVWSRKNSDRCQNVKMQTFFQRKGLRRYFIVHVEENNEPSAPHEVADVVQAQLARWEETRKIEEEKMQVMDAEAAKTDKTGWFKRTGWLEHLANRNRKHLAHQMRLPDRSEVKLQRAGKLVELLIERSVKGLSTLARESRRWLRSAKMSEADVRPLARLQNPESQATYASYIVKFVCYFLRVLADEERRIAQFRRGSVDDSDAAEDSDTDSFGSGRSGSEAGSNSCPRRQERRRREADLMKDARELFCWQGEQKGLAITLWDMLDGADMEAQINALLDVLASFIFQSVSNDLFRSGLLHFLAVLGIDGEMDRLRTAKNYSYMLAGVVYCVRVLAVEKLLPAAQRDEQTDEDRDRFLAKRQKFLADGSYSPMSEMIGLLAYGKSVALAAGNSGNAYWSKDKKIFYLNGRPISINRFCEMARDIVAETERMLWQELLWVAQGSERFAISLDQVTDDVTFTRRGESFITRRDNGLNNGLEWMLTWARQREPGQKMQSSTGGWSWWRVKRYLRQVDCFLELLLVCVHMTSGQPGRGSEVTTMRHRNGVLQDRNIFVTDGQIMTVVRYHKSQSQWDKPKIVPRFLPPQVGQMLAVYLAYLQPFQEYLRVEVLGGSFSDYIWGDEQGPWKTDRLTRLLKRETGKRLGVELHTLDYRHTAVGIGREVVGETFSKGYQDEVGEVEEAEMDEEEESALELQNSRTTMMGVGNYSVRLDIVKHLSVRSMETFRPLSTRWHQFLGLAGGEEGQSTWTGESIADRRRKRQRQEENRVEERERRVSAVNMREEEVRRAMQQVLGQEEVGFRSVQQEQAMYAVLDGQTPLVVVLPTGGGKSLLFTVPAFLEAGGVTVVVVPYRALIEDLVQRIQNCGVDCIEWKHGETNPAAVVVVSADVAGDVTSSGNFISYAGMLSSKGLLRRVVVDECHLIFTSSDWRPKLAKLKSLRLLPCPIVLLTATLPPVREEELGESMQVRVATYIRASTVRPNTRYFVSWCEKRKGEETALAMCRRQQVRLKEKRQRGIVYCRSKAQCEAIAEALGCGHYHAGVVDRAERLEAWLKEGGLIVATSALGTGVDFPRIVLIVHVGMPWSMVDFAQESGRGGRAGEVVDSVLVVEQGEVERRMEQQKGELDVQAMGLFIIGSGCRRGLMSGYLDGKSISCNDIESAGCDRCGEGIREVQEAQSRASAEWEDVRAMMDEIRHGCGVCFVAGESGSEGWKRHKTVQCTAHAGLTATDVDRFRRFVCDSGERIHSCRRCWVSQKYCATGESMSKRCQWPNVVIPVVRAIASEEQGVGLVRGCGYTGELGGDWKEYAGWLAKRHAVQVWGEYFSNAMVVAIRVLLFCRTVFFGRE